MADNEEYDIFSQFASLEDASHIPPSGVIPQRHKTPDWGDPSAPPLDLDSVFPGDVFSQFMASEDVLYTFPPGMIPQRHTNPGWDDPTVAPIDLDAAFSGDLKLTDTKEGICRQKANHNIIEIVDAICHRYEFASLSGSLAVYHPPCWRIMERQESMRFVTGIIKHLFPHEAGYLSVRQYREICFHIQHHKNTICLSEIPTPDYNYLCCKDHLYDWHSRECIPHDSSYLWFSSLALGAEDIGRCSGEYWERFLEDLTGGNPALRQRVLEVIGVILSGYPSKSFFLLEGEGDTGKSQLANVLRDILGPETCFALNGISQLADRWTTGSLLGKLLCVCGDVPDTPLTKGAVGTIKQLTGGDLIRGERKYKDPVSFMSTAKLLFVSNHPLQLSDADQALLDRLVSIPCRNPIPKSRQIPNLHKHLHEEAGYIVGLAMEALVELEARNGVFTPLPSDLQVEVVRVPDAEQDIIDFVRHRCVLDQIASCSVSSAFQAFQDYTPECGIDRTQFSKLLYRLYPQVTSGRSKTERKYCGLRLADSPTSRNPS